METLTALKCTRLAVIHFNNSWKLCGKLLVTMVIQTKLNFEVDNFVICWLPKVHQNKIPFVVWLQIFPEFSTFHGTCYPFKLPTTSGDNTIIDIFAEMASGDPKIKFYRCWLFVESSRSEVTVGQFKKKLSNQRLNVCEKCFCVVFWYSVINEKAN